MSSGTDRFFEEMLDSARRAARKDVQAEVRNIKAENASLKKENNKLKKDANKLDSRQRTLDKREDKIKARESGLDNKYKRREQDLKNAEKEIIKMLDQIEKIQEEEVVTTTTKARAFVKRSTTRNGWYGSLPTITSSALNAVQRRVATLKKKEKENK